MGKASTYRGRPLMQAAFSRDQISNFARDLNMIADEAEPAPEARAPFSPADLDPDLSDVEPLSA